MRHRTAPHTVLFALLIAVALIAPGCTSVSSIAVDEPQPREGNVILVRGLMDIFSLGLHDIESDLREQGVNAMVVSGPRWPDVSKTVKREYSEGRLNGQPLVIVGHSYGADDAVRLARSLDAEDIRIEVLALIDPTTPPKIPDNVVRCFNLYQSSPATDWIPVLRGVPVKAENGSTEVVNFDIRKHNEDGRFSWNNHFNIEEDEDVHAVIVQEVLKACPPNGHYAKRTDGDAQETVEQTASSSTGANGSGGYADVHDD